MVLSKLIDSGPQHLYITFPSFGFVDFHSVLLVWVNLGQLICKKYVSNSLHNLLATSDDHNTVRCSFEMISAPLAAASSTLPQGFDACTATDSFWHRFSRRKQFGSNLGIRLEPCF